MDSCIRSSASHRFDACLAKIIERVFELLLNTASVFLNLKALKISAVVFENGEKFHRTEVRVLRTEQDTLSVLSPHGSVLLSGFLFGQFEQHHFGGVAVALSKLDDAGIAALAFLETRSNLFKQFFNHFFVADGLEHQTA